MVNSTLSPEFSRPIKVKGLPADPVAVEADAEERAALAHRFGLPCIETLRAEVALEQRPGAIRATGTLNAAIRQMCAISGEDFPTNIDEAIDLRFVEETMVDRAIDNPEELELEADDCDEIDYSGDTFDLGEAVAQTLGLAVDPYAEGPEADAARKREGIVVEGEQEGPLAEALKGLKGA